MKYFLLNIICFIAAFFLFSNSTFAQRKLQIDGTLSVGAEKLENATVTVFQDGAKTNEVSTKSNGKFDLELELEHVYMLVFGKEGFVSKKIEVDTRGIPEDEKDIANLYYGKWKVELFEESLGLNTQILNQPIGKVSYNPTYMQFGNDDKYTKSIRKQLDDLLAELEEARKQQLLLEEQLEEDYYLAIKDGDAFFKEKDYENALFQYQAALSLKPGESYPKKMLEKVQEELGASEAIEEQYAALLTNADESFEGEKYQDAIGFYQDALTLKPNEDYPKEQIELAEKAIAELAEKQEKLEEYNKIIAEADISFNGQAYEEAKDKYESALKLIPTEKYPQERINEIDAKLAELENLEKAYELALKDGESALKAEEYDAAKGHFEKAAELNPSATRPPAALKEIETALAALAAMEASKLAQAKAEQEKLDAEYDAFITTGDNELTQQNFEPAKKAFESALELKPDESYPKEKLAEINTLQAGIAASEEAYEKHMDEASSKFKKKDYEGARSSYNLALEVKPNEQEPKDAILEINKLLEADAAAAAAEQAALAAEQARIQKAYDEFITAGDEAFNAKNYQAAISSYEKALELKENESYPTEKIVEINSLLANAAEKDETYAQAIKEADKLFAQEAWNEAKSKYSLAQNIKPAESYPNQRIEEIDAKLAAIAAADAEAARIASEKQAQLDKAYNQLLADAKDQETAEQYKTAISKLEEAATLKPNETFPQSEIARITGLMGDLAAAEAARLKAEKEAKEREEKYLMIIDNADGLFNEKRYTEAKEKYNEAIQLKPEETYPVNQIAKIDAELDRLAAEKEAERLAAEEARKQEMAFSTALAAGSSAMSSGNYTEARTKFDEAKSIKPQDQLLAKKYEELEALEAEAARIAEEKRLAEEREKAKMAEYTAFMTSGEQALQEEDYDNAKSNFEKARDLFPEKEEPKIKLKELADIQEELRNAAAQAENDTELNYELAKKYPQGRTENVTEKGNKTVTQVVIVKGNRGDEYIKERYSWGQEFYLKNGKPYNKNNWLKETRK